MKTTKLLFLLTLTFTSLTFSSCSSDNDNDGGGGSTNFGPKNVFTGDLPKTINTYTFKYNSNEFLEEVSSHDNKITFEYPSQTKSIGSIAAVTMKNNDLSTPEDSYTVKFTIGSNGFASSALVTHADNSIDTWELKYNNDGQLNYMKRSGAENEVTTITYANWNITGIKMVSDDKNKETITTTSIEYTSETQANGLENKGCIMLFDKTIGIELNELYFAYYAGLLGRATKKLPLKKVESYSYVSDTYTTIFNWTFNTKGYPTKLSSKKNNSSIENINFGW